MYLYELGKTTMFKIEMGSISPELGHSCNALAIRVFAIFFSPALYSNRTDSNLVRKRLSDDIYDNTFIMQNQAASHMKVTGNCKHLPIF